MNRNMFVLLLSAFVMLGFASAGGVSLDFQDETLGCSFDHGDQQSQGYIKCTDLVRQKYIVSKKTACGYKDGLYQLPIEAKRPDKKVITSQFYKYNNKVYYPLSLDYPSGGSSCKDGMEYRLYQYNCSTKKSSDLRIEIPNCGVSIVQANKGKILLLDGMYEGGGKDFYRMFDIKSMLISFLDIQKFKGFSKYKDYIKGELEKLFNTTDKKFISADYPTKINGGMFAEYWKIMDTYFPYNGYNGGLEINDINSKFIGNLRYRLHLSNGNGGSHSISEDKLIKIDFLKKIIMMK